MIERFKAAPALRSLKAFQRATVDYVSRRLLIDEDAVRHFLVADEVGLGKTMVARGVIARTIEALQDTVKRIDIVYICSNAAIARQNVARLNVMGEAHAKVLPTRLTMLALELARAGGIKEEGVNFFSLTPGTSLDLKQGGGMKQERALILRLIWDQLKDRKAVAKMLQGYAGAQGWRETRRWIDAQPIEPQIAKQFQSAIAARPALLEDLENCAHAYKGQRLNNTELNRRRDSLVGELRTILARESAEALEPDLIVLDEFQRFTELLHGESEAAELARRLFDATDPDGNQAKVLLLSATPYRILSLRDDAADAGDHYKEFLDVLGFLFGEEHGAKARQELEMEMRRMRNALQMLPSSFEQAKDIKMGIERQLKQVIARTERVSETAERDAMVRDMSAPITLKSQDLLEARAIARVAEAAEAPGTVEYWKSAPYLLSFLRDYKLGQKLEAQKDSPSETLLAAIRGAGTAQVDVAAVKAYRPIHLSNGRMHALQDIASQNGLDRRLWMPPSLPYFGARIAASKVLVFSQWAMVPDSIAALLSYESERRMGMGDQWGSYTATHSQRLNFRRTKGRLTGLRVLSLVIPSPTLAATVDPLEIFKSVGAMPNVNAMRSVVKERLKNFADDLALRFTAAKPSGFLERFRNNADDAADERVANWDWACAASMDISHKRFGTWLAEGRGLDTIVREDGLEAWNEHLAALHEAASAKHLFGSPDRSQVLDHLTDLALGSPANCALRALARVAPDLGFDHPNMLSAATRIGMAFRGLFNQPESIALLRGSSDEFYWQAVLQYCAEHDLQSVMDEYVHMLLESEGLSDADPCNAVTRIAEAIDEALSLKPAQIDIKSYKAKRGRIEIQSNLRMRGRFATRLLQKSQEDGQMQRTDNVRGAFNSPFRPFVLATTSVGQEGLDFHFYCHRLVHWNLPTNPVDLEQREGRVHRFKNHAVRLNVSEKYANDMRLSESESDPWKQMFSAARSQAKRGGELEPFWLFDGDISIERYALSLPFSREISLMAWLKRSVAIYRLAFGQPRQDDLLSFLEKAGSELSNDDLAELQINLRPPEIY